MHPQKDAIANYGSFAAVSLISWSKRDEADMISTIPTTKSQIWIVMHGFGSALIAGGIDSRAKIGLVPIAGIREEAKTIHSPEESTRSSMNGCKLPN